MAILGIPSGTVVQRLGSRTTMLVADLARAPILASLPLLHAAGRLELRPAARASSRCSAASCRRTSRHSARSCPSSSARTRRACRRRTARSRAATRFAALIGPALAGAPHPVPRRVERPLRRRGHLPRRVPARARVRARGGSALASAGRHGVLAGLRFLSRDTLLGAARPRRSSSSASSAPGISAGLPVYAYDDFDGRSWIAGSSTPRSAPAPSWAASLAMVIVQEDRRRCGSRLSGSSRSPCRSGCSPFLPPWPVVFVALFTATLFTPLVNGPVIGVLTARTPDELRPKVMTAADLARTRSPRRSASSSPARCSSTGASCRSSPPSSSGSRGWRSCSPRSPGGTRASSPRRSRARRRLDDGRRRGTGAGGRSTFPAPLQLCSVAVQLTVPDEQTKCVPW